MGHPILVVDDDEALADTLRIALAEHGFDVTTASSVTTAREAVSTQDFDAVVADLHIGTEGGLNFCSWVRENREGVVTIIITAHADMDAVLAALRTGVDDFLQKPVNAIRLAHTLKRSIELAETKREVERLKLNHASPLQGTLGMVGNSPAIQRIRDLVIRLDKSDASVMVVGESGVGKELIARALHQVSGREGPFLGINCAALPATLLESELFGHTRGAFTDAHRDRAGLFLRATGGTLFLDEIGEMPCEMQAKLLRTLEQRTVRPVGADEEKSFDTRIIAATNRDLEEEVKKGRFREDLYYRLNVLQIDAPPLRSRGNDILLLAQYFVEVESARSHKKVTGISPPAAKKLLVYPWPGNVRELHNCIERAIALTQFTEIIVDDLPKRIAHADHDQLHLEVDDEDQVIPLAEVEKRYIKHVLDFAGGNKSKAARLLQLDRRTLYRKIASIDGDPGGDSQGGSPRL